MTKITREHDILEEEYNRYPYQSFPFWQSHPTHLYTLGKLFGMRPKPVEKAKVLELGCASGGNLIPMAYHFPDAEFVGIDLADKQIQEGSRIIDELRLSNIKLKHQSILDFHPKEGKFDYIICHGVYSWVDDQVREKILEICNKNLDKEGIAYISYNTFPGWNMVNSVRDLMMWHTKNIPEPENKAKQARMILKFITDGLKDDPSPYANFLKGEINLLMKHADSYLLHDHLSSYNDPVYFYQFMEKANQHELSYLSDAFPASMFAENLPPVFSTELKKINNIIVAGQYMDFIRNQRFRCTLLCHKDIAITRSLKTVDIENYYLQIIGKPVKEDFNQNDIGTNQEVAFANATTTLRVKQPISQWALLILHEEREHLIHYQELCKKIMTRSGVEDINLIKRHLDDDINLMRAALAGLVNIESYPSTFTLTVSDKPLACPLAVYQAKNQSYVTNRRHQVIKLDPAALELLPHLDGKHTFKSLEKILQNGIAEGKLTMLGKDKQVIQNKEDIQKYSENFCKAILDNFAKQGLLISPPE